MPSAAGCSTKVSGDTYAQRLSGSEGDGANEGLFHTDLPQPLVVFPPDIQSSDSSLEMATKSRDWSSLASPFNGYECEIIGSTRPKEFFSTSADTHSQI